MFNQTFKVGEDVLLDSSGEEKVILYFSFNDIKKILRNYKKNVAKEGLDFIYDIALIAFAKS